MKRIVILTLVMAMLLCIAAGCGKKPDEMDMPEVIAADTAETPSPTPEATPSPTPEATPEASAFVNPLTGEPVDEDISANRPVAIMINNVQSAQPTHGLSQASVIYEMPVEGWTTRMIALFQEYAELDVVGSVRSARPCFVEVADAYDALYFHAGGSDDGMNLIWEYGVNNVSATEYDGVYFYRDSWRSDALGYEHSMMTTGELLVKAIERMEYSTEHDADYAQTMVFAESISPSGTARTSSPVSLLMMPKPVLTVCTSGARICTMPIPMSRYSLRMSSSSSPPSIPMTMQPTSMWTLKAAAKDTSSPAVSTFPSPGRSPKSALPLSTGMKMVSL